MKNFNQILPTEIISEILTRLPTESVLEGKSVCKTWKNLIQHPKFPKLHLARLNHPDSAESCKLRYVISHPDDAYDFHKHVCYFEFNKNEEDWNYVKPILRQIKIEPPVDGYIIIGSFNGLICIYGTQPDLCEINGPALIFNPVTREHIVLPEPEYDEAKMSKFVQRVHETCGFGYLAETNEYKVVRIYRCVREPNVVEVEVYTVGSCKGWRHVGKFDLGFGFYPHWGQTNGVFLNGCLHWRNTKGGMIVVFDLAEEKFREHIPPPPLPTNTDEDYDVDSTVLRVSGGGILYYAVCQFRENEMFGDVWLLVKKDDNHVMRGHEQSWVWSQPDSLEQTEPFAFAKQDNVLRYDQGNIKYFSTWTSTWQDIVEFSEICVQVFPHKHTLISLKELGEEDAKIMKSCGLEETYSSEPDSN